MLVTRTRREQNTLHVGRRPHALKRAARGKCPRIVAPERPALVVEAATQHVSLYTGCHRRIEPMWEPGARSGFVQPGAPPLGRCKCRT